MAIEVETGRELWTSDQSFGKYLSLVAKGDRILALDQRGVLFLLRANKKKFDVLEQRELADAETWAHLAARFPSWRVSIAERSREGRA